MFSSANQQPFLDLSVGVNELRGAYLAQEMWNQLDTGQRKPPFLLRILLANFGGDSLYATQAATQIQQLAEQDSSVLAVTGMGQTREQTVSAATVLGTATGTWSGIPVVTSAPTGDALAGKDYVFMTAATNDRQADVGTAFVQSHFPNRKLYVIYDSNDLYSSDLQESYARSLAAAGLPAAVPEVYDANSNDTRQSLSGIVGDICAHSGPSTQAPLILYAGRANELPTFMDLLQGDTCDQRAVVLGDDDLTQEETNGYADLNGIANFVDSRLYFTSFGPTKAGWQQILANGDIPADLRTGEQSAETNFFNAYSQVAREEQKAGGNAYQTPANGHVMLAYDAVNLAVSAIQNGVSGNQLPTRDQVYDALRATTGAHAYPGVSGPIDFQTTDQTPLNKGGFDANKLIVVQQVRKDPKSGKLGSAYVYSQP
jgi:ABC-type branched-subunit amino acid transport system substrate-binding protein